MAKPGSSNWANAGGEGPLQDVSFDRLEPQEAFYSDINPGLRLPKRRGVCFASKRSRAEPMLIRLAGLAAGAFQG